MLLRMTTTRPAGQRTATVAAPTTAADIAANTAHSGSGTVTLKRRIGAAGRCVLFDVRTA